MEALTQSLAGKVTELNGLMDRMMAAQEAMEAGQTIGNIAVAIER